MKYLFVLSLLLIVGGYIFWRLRPYLLVARRVLGALRDVRRMSVNVNPSDLPRQQRSKQTVADSKAGSNERLVPCSACGTWTPAAHAITLRSTNSFYCSHDCLERAADAPRRTHKSAS